MLFSLFYQQIKSNFLEGNDVDCLKYKKVSVCKQDEKWKKKKSILFCYCYFYLLLLLFCFMLFLCFCRGVFSGVTLLFWPRLFFSIYVNVLTIYYTLHTPHHTPSPHSHHQTTPHHACAPYFSYNMITLGQNINHYRRAIMQGKYGSIVIFPDAGFT